MPNNDIMTFIVLFIHEVLKSLINASSDFISFPNYLGKILMKLTSYDLNMIL